MVDMKYLKKSPEKRVTFSAFRELYNEMTSLRCIWLNTLGTNNKNELTMKRFTEKSQVLEAQLLSIEEMLIIRGGDGDIGGVTEDIIAPPPPPPPSNNN